MEARPVLPQDAPGPRMEPSRVGLERAQGGKWPGQNNLNFTPGEAALAEVGRQRLWLEGEPLLR